MKFQWSRSLVGGVLAVFAFVSVIAFAASINCPTSGGSLCEGTGDPDTITGTANNDIILADNGADTVNAGEGNDVVDGDEGNDSLNGEGGDDYIAGGQGNDILSGGPSKDSLFGGGGNDVMDGGEDNDLLVGNAGNDVMTGGKGDDVLLGQGGNDDLDGGDDNDTLRGSGGNDNLRGGKGNDNLFGGQGNDNLGGGDGDDFLSGGPGADNETGGPGVDSYDPDNPGPDTFFVNAGDVPSSQNEDIRCGGGHDRVIFTGNITQSGSSKVYNDNTTTGTYTVANDCEQVALRPASASLIAEPLAFEGFSLSSNVLSGDSIEFTAEGTGVVEMKLQVFTLAGRKLVEQTEKTGSLEFKGTTPNGDLLANGLYLYTLTVKGADGKLIRSELRKLAIRR